MIQSTDWAASATRNSYVIRVDRAARGEQATRRQVEMSGQRYEHSPPTSRVLAFADDCAIIIGSVPCTDRVSFVTGAGAAFWR